MLSIDLASTDETGTAYFYPEARGSVYKKYRKYVAGAAFSSLYYLFLDKSSGAASLTPQFVYRPAGFFAYFLNDRVTIPATAGYLLSPNGGGNVYTLYAHGNNLNVTAGQSVSLGDLIFNSGATGSASTGAHLLYEVIRTFLAPTSRAFFTTFSIRHSPQSLGQLLGF